MPGTGIQIGDCLASGVTVGHRAARAVHPDLEHALSCAWRGVEKTEGKSFEKARACMGIGQRTLVGAQRCNGFVDGSLSLSLSSLAPALASLSDASDGATRATAIAISLICTSAVACHYDFGKARQATQGPLIAPNTRLWVRQVEPAPSCPLLRVPEERVLSHLDGSPVVPRNDACPYAVRSWGDVMAGEGMCHNERSAR